MIANIGEKNMNITVAKESIPIDSFLMVEKAMNASRFGFCWVVEAARTFKPVVQSNVECRTYENCIIANLLFYISLPIVIIKIEY